jgi:hypothetical protein
MRQLTGRLPKARIPMLRTGERFLENRHFAKSPPPERGPEAQCLGECLGTAGRLQSGPTDAMWRGRAGKSRCHCEERSDEAIQSVTCGPGLLRHFVPRNNGDSTGCIRHECQHRASASGRNDATQTRGPVDVHSETRRCSVEQLCSPLLHPPSNYRILAALRTAAKGARRCGVTPRFIEVRRLTTREKD